MLVQNPTIESIGPAPRLELQAKQEESVKISLLINAFYYFIESVFIIEEKAGFRLVAIHRGRVLKNRVYKKNRFARAAFLRYIKGKAWNVFTRPQWTPFYPPVLGWKPLKVLKRKDS